MNFIIRKNGTVRGIANYLDDAQEFAERMQGESGEWSPAGQLVCRGIPTGWAILKMVAE